MIVDLIFDRISDIKSGYEDSYDAREFYNDCREYAECFESEVQWEIVDALDSGTNEDVQRALCKYIDVNEYNPKIKDFINSVKWICDEN